MNIIRRTIPTTNYDKTRKKIDRVVIHWFGIGTLKSADSRFSKLGEQSSAHYGISDETVYQWVDEAHTAYHSGNYAMNQRSVGIEHDATTTKNATETTYKTSGALVKAICDRHNIPIDRTHIIAHKEVKATQCPGTLDIDKIIAIAKQVGAIIEPPMDQDRERGIKKFDEYRTQRTQGTEGSYEGYASAIIGSDRDIDGLRVSVVSLKNEVDNLDNTINIKLEAIKSLKLQLEMAEARIFELSNNPPIVSPTPEFTNPVAKFFLKLAKFAEN